MPKAQGKRTDLVTSCDEVTTYAELGCGRMEALRWKLSAELSQPEFDSYITKTKESGGELASPAVRAKAQSPLITEVLSLSAKYTRIMQGINPGQPK